MGCIDEIANASQACLAELDNYATSLDYDTYGPDMEEPSHTPIPVQPVTPKASNKTIKETAEKSAEKTPPANEPEPIPDESESDSDSSGIDSDDSDAGIAGMPEYPFSESDFSDSD